MTVSQTNDLFDRRALLHKVESLEVPVLSFILHDKGYLHIEKKVYRDKVHFFQNENMNTNILLVGHPYFVILAKIKRVDDPTLTGSRDLYKMILKLWIILTQTSLLRSVLS